MDKRELLGMFITEYRNYFRRDDFKVIKQEVADFIEENEHLENEDFFKKFKNQFTSIELINESITRSNLGKISHDIRVIRRIIVAFFIVAILAAFITFFSAL